MSARQRALHHKRRQHNSALLLVIGAGFILLGLAAFLSLPRAQQEAARQEYSAIPVEVNFPAPDVELTDLNGQKVALSDFRGQVVLYNAWATWCPPCKQEMPTLQAYYEAHQPAGFVIVAIADGQALDEVRAFVQEYRLTFPVWPDPDYRASKTFRFNSLPTSFVIDREGNVRLTWTGAISRAMLERYVTPLLEQ
ncbi:MAG: TlpA family protein disulfide reductase [Anaerolineales bacterium]|nr:TlpA family protein disulfide reductase [Anaerolineales bacterium]MCX7755788.1 TlpA family protein disulfide reductase [Anaerolineales bacterium]MDW8279046.1 TlpA disulfide reductase family protein [Anaerolineales bacterium]